MRDRQQISDMSAEVWSERLFQRFEGNPFPLTGQWELTCRCNLKCVMCYTDPFNRPEKIRQELSYEEIVRILDEIHQEGCLELIFTGGEPFARRDFLDIYTYAKRKGFLLNIFTNGTLITPKIADHLKTYPPSMIEISLHALTRESFDQLTMRRGAFGHCLEGIRLILERDLPLTLKTVGMTINRDEILKIKKFVAGLDEKVQYKFGSDIRPRLDGSEGVYQYQLPKEEIRAIEQADEEFRAERVRQDRCKQEWIDQGKQQCGGGNYKFHIDAYGQLQLCSNNRRQGYDLRQGSFREGFYQYLPEFPCPARRPAAGTQLVNIGSGDGQEEFQETA
ncbi:MAG: radical SAM protein [Acidobacteria bacterium]|nr:radical SAM protein [Acidobacteriota bacterium]